MSDSVMAAFAVGESGGQSEMAMQDIAAAKEVLDGIFADPEYLELLAETIDGLSKEEAKPVLRENLAKIFKAEDVAILPDAKHVQVTYELIQGL